ncbi:MAG: hypothetical protein CMN78_01830 [Spirochaetales bacterium]|nr:hypothetical protein [Spirochaetales bacterium]
MKNLNNSTHRSVKLIPFLLVSCVAACSIAVFFFIPRLGGNPTHWKGYHPLLVDSEAELEPILDTLSANGLESVSSHNTYVHISRFYSTEQVSVARVGERLDVADPRLDPYIRGLLGFFTAAHRGDVWHVIYLHATKGPFYTWLRIRRALVPLGVSYLVPERIGLWLALSPPIFVLYVYFLSGRLHGKKRNHFVLSIPFFILAVRGGAFGFASAILILPGWLSFSVLILEQITQFLYWKSIRLRLRGVVKPAVFLFVGVVLSYFLSIFSLEPHQLRTAITWAVVTALAAIILDGSLVGIARILQEHRLFLPIRVLSGSIWGGARTDGLTHSSLLIPFIVLPAVIGAFGFSITEGIPRPVPIKDTQLVKWKDVQTLHLFRESTELPDISDYLTHRAFQEGLMYSQSWEFPVLDHTIAIADYQEHDGRILAVQEDAVAYNDEWFEKMIADASLGGITRMLVEQQSAAYVERSPPRSGLALVQQIALAFFILTPFIFVSGNLTANNIYGMRNLLLRRKRQTA